MLRRRLTGEEVASLAVKASAASLRPPPLVCRRPAPARRGSVGPVVFAPSEEDYSDETLATFAVKPAAPQKRRVAYRGGRSPPRFSPDLTAILESD
ncbi:hypothetical protein ZWY2020_017721 [Hordeum vulgare]|nr:hypothetical protein ZWY2020_017721 [Hordeum vulgare]